MNTIGQFDMFLLQPWNYMKEAKPALCYTDSTFWITQPPCGSQLSPLVHTEDDYLYKTEIYTNTQQFGPVVFTTDCSNRS